MRLLRFSGPLILAFLAAAPLAAQKTPTRPTKGAPAKAKADSAKADTVKKAPPPPVPEPPKFAYLQGIAVDSIHEEPLVGALIQIEGTNRIGATDSLGRFLIDSVPPGSHRLFVDHPLIDTLGITLVTPPLDFALDHITRTMVVVPTPTTIIGLFCPGAKRALGPGVLAGRVREPDTEEPAVGARVSLVYFDPDPPGLPANLKVKKTPKVREAAVTADGNYRICGLPATFDGKLQAQRRDGGATAEVTVSQHESPLTLRSMSVSAMPKAATDSAAKVIAQKGSARVFGNVKNASGAPLVGARVGLMGASAATITRANGDFVLDSLPSGTQAIVVRQIGYKPTEVPVELSSRTPARVNVQMGVFVPELTAVEVISKREEGLQKVGFSDRKRNSAGGHFIDPDQIEKKHAAYFTDLLRGMAGISVQNQNGQAVLVSTRTSTGDGAVCVWVDAAPWQSLSAGDLDAFLRPNEIAAVEVYQGSNVPMQFTTTGQTCATVVVWTKTRVDTGKR